MKRVAVIEDDIFDEDFFGFLKQHVEYTRLSRTVNPSTEFACIILAFPEKPEAVRLRCVEILAQLRSARVILVVRDLQESTYLIASLHPDSVILRQPSGPSEIPGFQLQLLTAIPKGADEVEKSIGEVTHPGVGPAALMTLGALFVLLTLGFLFVAFREGNLGDSQEKIVHFVMALCAGFSMGFMTGTLAVSGHMRVRLVKENPLLVSAFGGAGAFVLVLAIPF